MQLQEFIEQLQDIKKKHRGNVEVIMTDGIPVVAPVFDEEGLNDKKVIITDVQFDF
jgi:hypothetical protein